MRRIVAALVTLSVVSACAAETVQVSANRPAATVSFEGTDTKLYVEVADEPGEQRRGLMGVENLPADEGVAFAFTEPIESTFWMKDTLIPLSIAFVGEGGRVIEVLDMEPCESDPCPHYGIDEPYVLAIEANLGWFGDHGVDAGDRADLRTNLDG